MHVASAASGLSPLRHCGNTHAPTPTRDYRPSLRSPGRQRQSPYSASKIDADEIIRRIAITYDEAQHKGLESNVTDNLESLVFEQLRAI